MGSEQIESTVDDLLQIFLCSRKTISRRNQTVGKFPSGTAKWPFCLPLGNILSNSDFECCRGRGLAHIWEVVIIKTAQTIPPCRFCHGFQLRRLNESSWCFIRNYASEFQLPEQHGCGVIQGVRTSLWSQNAPFPSWPCHFLLVWSPASSSVSFCLYFLICKMQLWIIVLPTLLWSYCEE